MTQLNLELFDFPKGNVQLGFVFVLLVSELSGEVRLLLLKLEVSLFDRLQVASQAVHYAGIGDALEVVDLVPEVGVVGLELQDGSLVEFVGNRS